MNINISTATRGKLHAQLIVPRCELIPCLWLKIWANFPPAPQVEFSLSNMYVRGTMCFLCQVEWTARDPDSKEGRISLKCPKFRLVFHLTRWRDVWIPCGDPRESHSSLPHLDRGNHITLIPRRHTEFKASKGDDAWLFWKWIGIPISLFQLESEPWSPASPPEASVSSFQA